MMMMVVGFKANEGDYEFGERAVEQLVEGRRRWG